MKPVNVSAIGAYIREQREQAKISLRQLAQSAGISNPYLSQIERGLRRPSADILQQIAKGLRISAEALYVQAGFLEDRPAGSAVREAVLTDADLSERQKQMLIEIYESFRKETMISRAEGAELAGDQSGLAPDEAALVWPENLSPRAVTGQPRRLAIAAPYEDLPDEDLPDEDLAGEDLADDDVPVSPFGGGRDAMHPARLPASRGDRQARDAGDAGQDREPGLTGSQQGGTVHQFPPPSVNR